MGWQVSGDVGRPLRGLKDGGGNRDLQYGCVLLLLRWKLSNCIIDWKKKRWVSHHALSLSFAAVRPIWLLKADCSGLCEEGAFRAPALAVFVQDQNQNRMDPIQFAALHRTYWAPQLQQLVPPPQSLS